MLLQAITIDDRAYEVEKACEVVHQHDIFPNGCLPSLEVIARYVARRTDMQAVHLEDLTPHYVETLRRWRERFVAARAELEQLGYDERFRRLWTLYLSYCEAGFAERRICDVQMLLTKPRWRAPVSRPGLGRAALDLAGGEPRDRRQGVATGRAARSDGDRQLYEPRLRAAQPALG